MINGIRPQGLTPLALREDTLPSADEADIAIQPGSTYQPFRQSPVQLNATAIAEGRLTDDQRAQFEQLQQALPQDPATQASLNKLLVSGGLTKTDTTGKTLLDNLSQLTQPGLQLKGGADPQQLLSTLVNETADPTKIEQGTDNDFCGAAAAAQALASQNPAEYARIVNGLAMNGQVNVAGTHSGAKGKGSTLSLSPDFQANDPSRSLTQQYLAQPLTQLAAGPQERIDKHGDGHIQNSLVVGQTNNGQQVTVGGVQPGTYASQVADMQSDLTGRDYDAASLPPAGHADHETAADEARELLQTQVANHTQPAVQIDHHWYSVTGIDNQNVTMVDHFGRKSTMPVDDFFKKAVALTYDRNVNPNPPPHLRNYDAHGGPGGGWNPSAGQNQPGT